MVKKSRLAFFVLIQYRSVTQTDRRTDMPPLAIPAVSIARYANTLVKTPKQTVRCYTGLRLQYIYNMYMLIQEQDASEIRLPNKGLLYRRALLTLYTPRITI